MTYFKNKIQLSSILAFFLMISCEDKPNIADVAPEREDESVEGVWLYESSTVAGIGVAGAQDGDLSIGAFNTPIGIAEGLNGELFVADQSNHKVRKVIVGQSVSSYAGTGEAGFLHGVNGKFNRPYDVVVDSKGNVFLADYANHSIRKIQLDGSILTFAGTNSGGWEDGLGDKARFNLPFALAIDKEDNLYVSDHRNNRIRKITPEGVVSTIAGSGEAGFLDGSALVAKFNGPTGIAVDDQGNVYVSEYYNNTIRRVGADGMVSTIAGDGSRGHADGEALLAKFNQPYDVAVDANGNVYVADYSNHMIRFIDVSSMNVTTIGGDGVAGLLNGLGSGSRFRFPSGLIVGKNGDLFVVDRSNHVIRRMTKVNIEDK